MGAVRGYPHQFLLVLVLILISVVQASALVTVTAATGGTSISASSAGGTFTNLTGPILSEGACGEIGNGTIVLNVASGFEFDTSASVQIVMTRAAGGGPASRNINDVTTGAVTPVGSVSASQITFTVTDTSNCDFPPGPAGVRNILTFQNVSVRPLLTNPLASGNITNSGTSPLVGVSGSTNFGTLTEVVGAPVGLSVTPHPSTIGQNGTQSFNATTTDIFGNPVLDVTGTTVFTITPAAGGSFAANVYTPQFVGTWTVTGTNALLSGNATLTVTDTTLPVITRLGSTPVVVEALTAYVDAGANASDDTDGDITASIVTVNPVNTSLIGGYVVSYDVTDAAGNAAAQVTRTVNVVDTTLPVITLIGSADLNVSVGSSYVDAGATANDAYEGDLTSSIIAVNSVNTSVPGTYTVSYDVEDSSGNDAVQVNRSVTVLPDTTAPLIILLGLTPVTVEVGSVYVDAGANASDDVDGDITALIITSNPVNTAILGNYTVTYDVNDTSGNPAVQVNRTVTVVDTTLPVITLLGGTIINVSFSSVYVDDGANATDNFDGDITASIVVANPVNTSQIATFNVTFDVSDSSGNAAVQVTRTVNVIDTSAPVITLLGITSVDTEAGVAYVDAGANASDDVDGDLTAQIVTVNPVNISLLGAYSVTYDVNDSAGTPATQVTRTVNVVDTTIPVISLSGSDPVDVEVNSSYVDDGATATDSYDGNLTASIVTVNPVDTSTVAAYVVTYDVNDSSSNPATQVTRTVNVVDTTLPVIVLVGSDPVDVEVNSTYVDAGANASDNYDGDITASIVTLNSVNTAVLGSYVVTYDVNDSSNNSAVQVNRTVNVVDTTLPLIALLGSNPVDVEANSTYLDAGANASDNYDGDITASIVIVNPVNTSVLGPYTVTFDVNDTSGNAAAQVNRTVNVVDTTAPVITLSGSDPVNVEAGTAYVDAGATAADSFEGDLSASIVVTNPVNTSVLGTYIVTYDVNDSSGNAATQVNRTVNVVDTTAPVISLLGTTPLTIEATSNYSDAGADAVDSFEGNITASLIIVSTVNTSAIGAYSVTYDVNDSSSNAATQVTRVVNVVDTTAPVITLVGSTPQQVTVGASFVDAGAVAQDSLEGNLNASILVDNQVNASVIGSYVVAYSVNDSAGNVAVLNRTVNVVAAPAPAPSGGGGGGGGGGNRFPSAFRNPIGSQTASVSDNAQATPPAPRPAAPSVPPSPSTPQSEPQTPPPSPAPVPNPQPQAPPSGLNQITGQFLGVPTTTASAIGALILLALLVGAGIYFYRRYF